MYDGVMQRHGFIPANHEKPNWFPVSIGDIYDERGRRVPGYQRVWREDSGDTLAVHTSKYALIPYETQFREFDDALARSGLDLNEMAIATDLTHNGGRCFRQYILPAYLVEMPNKRNLAMRFIMFGSYDGSTSFFGRVGGYDFVCANTSVMGFSILEKRVRHSGAADAIALRMAEAIDQLILAARNYLGERERLPHWCEVPLDVNRAQDLFRKLPQATETLVEHLTSNFATREPATLWGAWNTLTTWSTHGEAKSNRAQVRADREKRVSTLVEGRDWRVLEDA